MDHIGFGILDNLENGKGRPKKPKTTRLKLEQDANLAKQKVIESKLSAEETEKNRIAEELNKMWLSPFNDAIWHSIGGD